jgi:hypothetical protein
MYAQQQTAVAAAPAALAPVPRPAQQQQQQQQLMQQPAMGAGYAQQQAPSQTLQQQQQQQQPAAAAAGGPQRLWTPALLNLHYKAVLLESVPLAPFLVQAREYMAGAPPGAVDPQLPAAITTVSFVLAGDLCT